ncbi:hypothetical protein G9A89_023131 [Geosiphon pyriformis]|nr:hypothetical protein G9A89_023131 [Geosiphon pyriformis]
MRTYEAEADDEICIKGLVDEAELVVVVPLPIEDDGLMVGTDVVCVGISVKALTCAAELVVLAELVVVPPIEGDGVMRALGTLLMFPPFGLLKVGPGSGGLKLLKLPLPLPLEGGGGIALQK